MNYTPQIIPARDAIGNVRQVKVIRDRETSTYVGSIESARKLRMASGRERGAIIAIGEGETPGEAVACAIADLDSQLF